MAKYLQLEHHYNTSKAVLDNLAQSTDVPYEELEARYESSISQELSKSNFRTEDFRKDVRFQQFERVILGLSKGSGSDDIEVDSEELLDPGDQEGDRRAGEEQEVQPPV